MQRKAWSWVTAQENIFKFPFLKRSEQSCTLSLICGKPTAGWWERKRSVWLGEPLCLPWGRSIVLPHVCGSALLDPGGTPHTPFPPSPGGKPAWGPPALAHVAPLSQSLVHCAAGTPQPEAVLLFLAGLREPAWPQPPHWPSGSNQKGAALYLAAGP